MGFSGKIAQQFQDSEITPLLALAGLLLGIFAVFITPREEEPQINVTFANIFVPYPGASAAEVEQVVTSSAEQVLSEIEGVKHIYSVSRTGMATLTVEYEVGEDRTQAIVRLYNAVYSNQDWLPADLGVGQPLIKPKGIDDVPVVTGTLWTDSPDYGAYELQQVAHTIESELKRVPGTRNIYTIGGPGRALRILIDPAKMAGYGLALSDLRMALQSANVSRQSGSIITNNSEILVHSGVFLSSAEEVAQLVVGMHNGAPVFLHDVATIRPGPDQPEQLVRFGTGPAASTSNTIDNGVFPAVTIAISKKPGTNAVDIADRVIERFEQLRGVYIPDHVKTTITRNYGETANNKALTLIKKLTFATASVIVLVLLALGWREAIIVGAAVIVTLAITLFASWAWGFTLNRVSLFALIFSIGILVDDAIVVVENIHRHMQMSDKSLIEIIPIAVDEVGGPTILATLTVIAALLPMAFVSGLMGPYMSPIPINASIGMLISLAVAFVVTPWASNRLLHASAHSSPSQSHDRVIMHWFEKILRPMLGKQNGAGKRRIMAIAIVLLIIVSIALVAMQSVVLKMLPFDNKSELQVIVDMPEGTPLEQTARVLDEMGHELQNHTEVINYQLYAGTSAPINFNGLVRQYYLRSEPHQGDIQVNLVDKTERDRQSHDIARTLRPPLQAIGAKYNANVKIAEVPPGPPVLAPLVAEVYGPGYNGQITVAKRLRDVFSSTDNIVDIDDSVEVRSPKWLIAVDRQKAARLGISQYDIVSAVNTLLDGDDASYIHNNYARYPVPIKLEAGNDSKAAIQKLLNIKVRNIDGKLIPVSEVVTISDAQREVSIHHKDLLRVVYVTADMAGELDSPLYGLFDIDSNLRETKLVEYGDFEHYYISQPANPYEYSLKWNGEWQITYETFRDMGIAYSIGLILIYLLVVAQFRSYSVPLIIMAPIPLTVIGVLPGHALLGAQFTATSMIGMIALAGIIVRNSILLVDFINEQVRDGVDFEQAVISSGAVRARPIILTGLAAMLGAFFILDDPIFNGLAISLIFGILVSTLLTLIVIPVLYYAFQYKRAG